MKNTKIVCTLGPASDSYSEIMRMVQSGMDIARLNFSHGTYTHHRKMIQNIRKVEKKLGINIPIIQDLQGPKIRTGELPEEGISVINGDKIILSSKIVTNKQPTKKIIIPVQYKGLPQDVKKNDIILIDDGIIELKVQKVSNTEIYCQVKHGGIIKSHKGISVPGATIKAATITPKDKKDLKFGLKQNLDYVALSFVKDAKDIKNLRSLIKKGGKNTKIIAKIERKEAVENLEEIVIETDGLMVARGDLGVNMPPEQVPLIQKKMIQLANKYAKPIITATQVLQSMINSPVPSRAEISDAANAVFDHTDAIMLSNESSVGKFPYEATRTLKKVAQAVEEELQKSENLISHSPHAGIRFEENANCLNACELAVDLNADKIIAYTSDGYTARQISKYRVYTPIITITPNKKIARELKLLWGLNEIYIAKIKVDNTENILKFLKKRKIVKKGDKIIVVSNASKKESLISTLKI